MTLQAESTVVADSAQDALPTLLSSFVGRERELRDLGSLLVSSRLLTLTGPGGSGKTRLAREAASRAHDTDRIAWVDLAPLTDASLLDQHLAQSLGLGERPGSAPKDQLRQHIGTQRFRLVLDNCEHLVDACALLVESLLIACPELRVLATSREALGVAGETAWLVPSMEMGEAIQLFVDRAKGVQPSFGRTPQNSQAITEICQRLDGIPLAIELAAARVRVLTPEQISVRLTDALRLLSSGSRTALPRHRTLRGTLEWSYALLTEWEQVLLERASVFAGTFSLEAAEGVCSGGTIDAEDVLDGVSTLVDKSLIVLDPSSSEARYRLLETVRQFSSDRLRNRSDAESVHLRHAQYYVELAERHAPRLFGGATDMELMRQLSRETPNMRSAAEWALLSRERNELLLRLGWALHWYWFARGQFEELRVLLTQALESAPASEQNPLLRARALVALGYVLTWQVKKSLVRAVMEEGLELGRDVGDDEVVSLAMTGVGAAFFLEGKLEEAALQLDEAIESSSRLLPHVLCALARYWRGWVAKERGELELSQTLLLEASEIGRAIRHAPAIAHPLSVLGHVQLAQERYDDARLSLREGLSIHSLIDDSWGMARGFEGMAEVFAHSGANDRAVRILGASDALRERISAPPVPSEQLRHEQLVASLRGLLAADFDRLWAEGRKLSAAQAVEVALEPDARAVVAESVTNESAVHEPSAGKEGQATRTESQARLVVRTLGTLEVVVDGQPVEMSAWGSSRVRELLAFILTQKSGCTKEQAGAALWPEASTEQVRNSFHVTLHRLRKALRRAELIKVVNERYQFDVEPESLDFDAAIFEKDATRSLSALRAREPGAADSLAKALRLYRGDFLQNETAGDWHLELRERLQRLFVTASVALGERLSDDGRHAASIETLGRAIARDMLYEAAWRALISAHLKAGERGHALRAYQKLAGLLKSELGATPDPATTALLG